MLAGEPVRWAILAAMFSLGMVQGLVWMTFSGSPDVAAEYYALGDEKATIDLLLNWGPIMYLPVAPLVVWGTRRGTHGAWATILVGTLLTAAGSLLRLAPGPLPAVDPKSRQATWLLHLAQALNGAAGPMNAVTPSLVAATWFPPRERTAATSTVFAIQAGAPALGFLLALPVRDAGGLEALMVAEAAAAVAVAIAWFVLPRRPRAPPSGSQSARLLPGPRTRPPRRRWLSSWVLFLSGGLTCGVFQVWGSCLPTQLRGVLPEDLLKWFAVVMGCASLAGNLLAGPLVESLGLQRKLGAAIQVSLVVQLAGFVPFAALMPGSPLPWGGGGGSAGALMALLVLASVAEGLMGPLLYELGAELTYPYPESFSGAVFSWITNAFGLLQLAMVQMVPDAWVGFIMAATCCASLLCMQLVRAEYPRLEVDEAPSEDASTASAVPLCEVGAPAEAKSAAVGAEAS